MLQAPKDNEANSENEIVISEEFSFWSNDDVKMYFSNEYPTWKEQTL